MEIAISRTLVNMSPELSDTGSIAGIFVDVDGIRRGINRTAVFRVTTCLVKRLSVSPGA